MTAGFDAFSRIDDLDDARSIHIHLQQRNARQSSTIVSGLHPNLDYTKVLKHLKKTLCCNGNWVRSENENTIRLSGDQRIGVRDFLVAEGICTKTNVKIHGY